MAEKSNGLVWEGVPDAAQLRNVLWGQLNDRHKVSRNLLGGDEVYRMLADQSDTPFDSHFGQPDFDPETVNYAII